jgi:hypothetical protein
MTFSENVKLTLEKITAIRSGEHSVLSLLDMVCLPTIERVLSEYNPETIRAAFEQPSIPPGYAVVPIKLTEGNMRGQIKTHIEKPIGPPPSPNAAPKREK